MNYYTINMLIIIGVSLAAAILIVFFVDIELNYIPNTKFNNTLNIGLALVGTGQVNTISKITTTVLSSQHQGTLVLVSLANGFNTELNDTQNQIKNGSVLELQVSESNPICYPVVAFKNGTITPLIPAITSGKYQFNQTSFNQNCDTGKSIEKIETWRIVNP